MNRHMITLGAAALALLAAGGLALGLTQDEPKQDDKKKEETPEISANYAEALRAKAADLDKREQDLLRREQELNLLEQELIKKMRAFENDRRAFDAEKNAWTKQRDDEEKRRLDDRIGKIASGYKSVKADIAAAQLVALYNENRNTALLVISMLDERTFGKIFSKISDPALAARIVEDLKQWRAGPAENVVGD